MNKFLTQDFVAGVIKDVRKLPKRADKFPHSVIFAHGASLGYKDIKVNGQTEKQFDKANKDAMFEDDSIAPSDRLVVTYKDERITFLWEDERKLVQQTRRGG